MSGTSSVPIGHSTAETIAPTPQNTPLTTAPLAAGLSRPTVPTIGEEKDEGDDNGSDANGPPQTPPEGARFDDPLKLGATGQAAMLGMVQARLQNLMGRSSGYIEGLPIGTKRKVEALKGVQVKWEDLHLQFKMESIELEKKVICLLLLGLAFSGRLMNALLSFHVAPRSPL
jgi:nucleosome assembly protein 1-like 1